MSGRGIERTSAVPWFCACVSLASATCGGRVDADTAGAVASGGSGANRTADGGGAVPATTDTRNSGSGNEPAFDADAALAPPDSLDSDAPTGIPAPIDWNELEGRPECDYVAYPWRNYGVFALAVARSILVLLRSEGLYILDVSDETRPVEVGSFPIGGGAVRMAMHSDLAFVATENGLQIVDVTVPAEPALVGSVATMGETYDIAVDGTVAHMADGAAGLRILDVSQPSNPSEVGRVSALATPESFRVIAHRGYAYHQARSPSQAIDGVTEIVDATIPSAAHVVGSLPGPPVDEMSGQFGFVGEVIYDLTDPAAPVPIGAFNACRTASCTVLAITVSNDTAFLAAGEAPAGITDSRWVHVANIADPSAPRAIADLRAYGEPRALATLGRYLFVGSTEGLFMYAPEGCL